MSETRDAQRMKLRRKVVINLIAKGLNASQIAKQTGLSYAVVKLIYEQEKP